MVASEEGLLNPTAQVSNSARLGRGVLVLAYSAIGDDVELGDDVSIGSGVVIEPGVTIGEGAQIDHGVVIRERTSVGPGARLGAGVVLGQRPSRGKNSTLRISEEITPLVLGEECQVGAGAVIYAGAMLGPGCYVADAAQVRENVRLGCRVSVGRAATVENDCVVGDDTKIQTGAYIAAGSILEENVFVGPMVTTTNDNFLGRTEERFQYRKGVTVRRGARIGGGAVILPGVCIGQEALVAAGSVVTRDVPAFRVVMGVPARVVRNVPDEQIIFRT